MSSRSWHLQTAAAPNLAFAMLSVPVLLAIPSPSRRFLYVLPFILLLEALWLEAPSDSETHVNYNFGLVFATWSFRIFDRIYFNIPEESFFRTAIDHPDLRPIATYSVAERFQWALHLLIVDRGVGWNWQVPAIPFSKHLISRNRFVWERVRKIFLVYGSLSVTSTTSRWLATTLGDVAMGRDASVRSAFAYVALRYLLSPLIITVGWALVILAHLSLGYNLVAILMVATGIGWDEPSLWPFTFGSFKDAYTIRRFWGRSWQKHLRRGLCSPGDFVVAKLPILDTVKYRLVRRYFLLYMAFFVSSIIHASGAYWASRNTANLSYGGAFQFFMAQAVAISLEDLLIWGLGSKHQKTDGKTGAVKYRALGYLITSSWFLYTVPRWWVNPLAEALGHNGVEPMGNGLMAVSTAADTIPFNPFKFTTWN